MGLGDFILHLACCHRLWQADWEVGAGHDHGFTPHVIVPAVSSIRWKAIAWGLLP